MHNKEILVGSDALDLMRNENREGYDNFIRVLGLAYQQTAFGKGFERHGNGLDFNHQPIMTKAAVLGTGAMAFQVSKKAEEAHGLCQRHEFHKSKADLLGAIVYAVAQYLTVEKEEREALKEPKKDAYVNRSTDPTFYTS